jgi:hypothetical protein
MGQSTQARQGEACKRYMYVEPLAGREQLVFELAAIVFVWIIFFSLTLSRTPSLINAEISLGGGEGAWLAFFEASVALTFV